MRQIVTDMREERPSRFQAINRSQRMLHRGVRGMWLVAQRVQKKNVEVLELAQRFLRNVAVVREIRGRSKAEAAYFRIAVDQYNPLEHRSKQFQRTLDRSQLDLRQ